MGMKSMKTVRIAPTTAGSEEAPDPSFSKPGVIKRSLTQREVALRRHLSRLQKGEDVEGVDDLVVQESQAQ